MQLLAQLEAESRLPSLRLHQEFVGHYAPAHAERVCEIVSERERERERRERKIEIEGGERKYKPSAARGGGGV